MMRMCLKLHLLRKVLTGAKVGLSLMRIAFDRCLRNLMHWHILPVAVVSWMNCWIIDKGEGVNSGWVGSGRGGLWVTKHKVALVREVLEVVRLCSDVKLCGIDCSLRIARNLSIWSTVHYLCLHTFIYNVKSSKPLVLYNRIALWSLDRCLEMTKLRKSHWEWSWILII